MIGISGYELQMDSGNILERLLLNESDVLQVLEKGEGSLCHDMQDAHTCLRA
jgi:hypothetical protein